MKLLNIFILFYLQKFILSLNCEEIAYPSSKKECHDSVLDGMYSSSNAYCCYIKGKIKGSPDSITTCKAYFMEDIDDEKYKVAENYFLENTNCEKIEEFDCHNINIKFNFGLYYIFILLLF